MSEELGWLRERIERGRDDMEVVRIDLSVLRQRFEDSPKHSDLDALERKLNNRMDASVAAAVASINATAEIRSRDLADTIRKEGALNRRNMMVYGGAAMAIIGIIFGGQNLGALWAIIRGAI